jgi:type IV secretory pathway TraG/TraD family ATPase VirD4
MQGTWLAIFILLALLAYAAAYFLLRDALLPGALRGLCALAGGLALEALRRGIRPDAPSDAHGSARFDSPPRSWLGGGESGDVCLGLHRSHPVRLPRHQALRHGFILGPSGSGKSFGFFIPNAAQSVRASCVFTDPKSELWRRTAGLHPTALRFAPGEPDQSAAFNWVPLCRDARMAELIARAIVMSGNTQRTEQVWLDLEAGFLAALCPRGHARRANPAERLRPVYQSACRGAPTPARKLPFPGGARAGQYPEADQ